MCPPDVCRLGGNFNRYNLLRIYRRAGELPSLTSGICKLDTQCHRHLRGCTSSFADPLLLAWSCPWSAQMIAAPKARVTRRLASTDAILVPMALAYAFLLAHSWQADTLKLILPGSLQEGLSGTIMHPLQLRYCIEPHLHIASPCS